MSAGSCPAPHELARAVSEGADEALRRHLAACATCAAEWSGQRSLVALARELPGDEPDPGRLEALRAAVLAGAIAPEAARRRPWFVAASAIAAGIAVAGALVVVLGRGQGPDRRGTVREHAGAAYLHVRDDGDEVVRLTAGAISVQVAPLAAGERFRVVAGDAEVEVRGTLFDVGVDGDRLAAVRVIQGRVEVRPRGGPVAVLGPGDRWAPAAAAGSSTAPARPVAPAVHPVSSPAPPEPEPAHERPRPPSVALAAPGADAPRSGAAAPPAAPEDPAERAFEEGWAALREGGYDAAATAFANGAGSAGGGPLAEDCAYWNAVALARGGRAPDAIAAFRGFAKRYPAAPRRGEVFAALGWLLVDAGELAEAERTFGAAASDPVSAVRESARAGLRAIAERRGARAR